MWLKKCCQEYFIPFCPFLKHSQTFQFSTCLQLVCNSFRLFSIETLNSLLWISKKITKNNRWSDGGNPETHFISGAESVTSNTTLYKISSVRRCLSEHVTETRNFKSVSPSLWYASLFLPDNHSKCSAPSQIFSFISSSFVEQNFDPYSTDL